jgi:FkbM family methyltransferase
MKLISKSLKWFLEINFGKNKRILKVLGFTIIDTRRINCDVGSTLSKYTQIDSPWKNIWIPYFESNDITKAKETLSEGLDEVSNDYITRIVILYRSIFNGTNIHSQILIKKDFAWSDKDREIDIEFSEFKRDKWKKICKKYNKASEFDPYLFFNSLGLREISDKIRLRVSQGSALDCGAYIGDTACMLLEEFTPKSIVAFEPDKSAKLKLDSFISENCLSNKIVSVKSGLSDQKDKMLLFKTVDNYDAGASFSKLFKNQTSYEEEINITTIDEYVNEHKIDVSLIKMDIEGFEKKAIIGASRTIKEQRPVLVISIYHRPQDFFEIKPLIESWDLDYKFMIRRAEAILPIADIVLIAY